MLVRLPLHICAKLCVRNVFWNVEKTHEAWRWLHRFPFFIRYLCLRVFTFPAYLPPFLEAPLSHFCFELLTYRCISLRFQILYCSVLVFLNSYLTLQIPGRCFQSVMWLGAVFPGQSCEIWELGENCFWIVFPGIFFPDFNLCHFKVNRNTPNDRSIVCLFSGLITRLSGFLTCA